MDAPRLTPEQLRVFDDLLAVGGVRPHAPVSLVEELRERVAVGTAAALERWTERSLWIGKAQLASALRCEGQLVADAATPREAKIPAATATGTIVHRAIQIAHTHQGRTPEDYVRLAIAGSNEEESFREFWDSAPEHVQSDCQVAAVSRLVGFLDAFPPLDVAWTPRFEESLQAKVGRLTLSARPDLILGRPRANGRQTMFIADVKSTELRDFHFDEAQFYALVAALRFGCVPYRSTVYSLAAGDWTDPDVTAETLRVAADRVAQGVTGYVEALTEARPPTLAPGRHCTWCPAKADCPAQAAWEAAGRPEDAAGFVVAPMQASPRPVSSNTSAAPGAAAAETSAPDGEDPWAL